MKLNKFHKQELINQLLETEQNIRIKTLQINKELDEQIKAFFEIELFILEKSLELIKESLVEDEIDF